VESVRTFDRRRSNPRGIRAPQHRRQPPLRPALGVHAVTELAQHREVEPCVSQLQSQGVLPVRPRAYRVRGNAVAHVLHRLQPAHQCQQPGRRTGTALVGEPPGEAGIVAGLTKARVKTFADKGYQGAGPGISVPHRSRRKNPDTGKYLPLSHNQRCVNAAHARLRAPGERANAQLKTWKILRQLHSSPSDTTTVINAVQTLILNG
jgi:hypothetical protein